MGLCIFFSFKICDLLKKRKTFKQHKTNSTEHMQDIKRISELDPVRREMERVEQLVTIERAGKKTTDESEFCLYPCTIKIFWPNCTSRKLWCF